MKRISFRARFVLLLALLILAGLGYYVWSFTQNAGRWASFSSGISAATVPCTIRDRNGVLLAFNDGTERGYAEDREIRMACYHVTGDHLGRTGAGLLTLYCTGDSDYSILSGSSRSSVDLELTIDSEISRAAFCAMEGRSGVVMLMNYRTGEVLTMFSSPTTDPLDSDAVLLSGTFLNKCVSSTFVPGSIFKLVTAAAAIETVSPFDRIYSCEGEYDIAGVRIGCAGTHYDQSFNDAMANSCNCAFARLAVLVGHSDLTDYVRDYGFVSPHKLDRITSAAGSFPSEYLGDPELAWAGIGQSTDLLCPYTMLRFVAAVANNGVLVEPTLFRASVPGKTTGVLMQTTAEMLRSMMIYNAGVSYNPDMNFPGLSIAAKTGTAELGDGTSHSWFTGFLRDPDHPYAFIVLVEQGGSGLSAAGAVANTVLQTAVSR